MLYNETFWIVFAIFFWVLLALLVVTLFADTYVKIMYYKWDSDARRDELIKDKVGGFLENEKNPGGVISDDEN